MGLQSNRKLGTLKRLVQLLHESRHAPAARKALGRYTKESFETPREWQAWFEKDRNRIYFTDVGGYKFLVRPEGYPIRPQPPRQP